MTRKNLLKNTAIVGVLLLFSVCTFVSAQKQTRSPNPTTQPGIGVDQLLTMAKCPDRDLWFIAAKKLGDLAGADLELQRRIWTESRVNTLGMRFVRIDSGSFSMGPDYHRVTDPYPPQETRISQPFFLCVTETTNAQVRKLLPNFVPDSRFSPDDECPAVGMTVKEIQLFLKRLSDCEHAEYRLPTEAEWEYSCRAGSKSKYCFGDDEKELDHYAWWGGKRHSAARVGLLQPNPWGLYDMHGNALELVHDYFWRRHSEQQSGKTIADDGLQISGGIGRILRGGEWRMLDPTGCESSIRIPWPLIDLSLSDCEPKLSQMVGFRVVRSERP